MNAACPRCGASDTRESGSTTFWSVIMHAFSKTPIRCRWCRHRFYRRTTRVTTPGEPLAD